MSLAHLTEHADRCAQSDRVHLVQRLSGGLASFSTVSRTNAPCGHIEASHGRAGTTVAMQQRRLTSFATRRSSRCGRPRQPARLSCRTTGRVPRPGTSCRAFIHTLSVVYIIYVLSVDAQIAHREVEVVDLDLCLKNPFTYSSTRSRHDYLRACRALELRSKTRLTG